jgi:ferredoxin-NADP reductase
MKLILDGEEIRRNYSLSALANKGQYRISVKREPAVVPPTICTINCTSARASSCSRHRASSP